VTTFLSSSPTWPATQSVSRKCAARAERHANRQIGVSEVTYYRWRQEFGGLKTEQVKRLKDLELENRLRKAVSDLTLDKLILQEVARGNF
jgi:putative transposase